MSEEAILEFRGEYRWLSNFWLCPVSYDEQPYPSVEHAYQAAKTMSISQRNMIRVLKYPGEAKRAGRRVTVRSDWDQVRVDVMRGLLQQKFAITYLRDKLLATGSAHIEEGNQWHDEFWGVDTRTRRGQNMLGKLIMEIREELRSVRE